MNKPLFYESLNYIDPKTISEHISQKQKRMKKSTFSESKGLSELIKRPIGILVAILLIIAMVGSVIAVSFIIKSKNKYQVAHDQGIPIEEVDSEGEFKYTKIETGENDDLGEHFDDPKTDIYCKMLNTIDHINLLELTMTTSMLTQGETTLTYKINIDDGVSNEIEYVNGELRSETFSADGNMVNVNHFYKVYYDHYLPCYTREDTPYIPLAERIETMDGGLPAYTYRRNITNCPLASYCIVPEGLAYSYLKNFEKWEITGDEEYLGRECVLIEGTTTPYFNEKHGGDSFKMTVDSETGILMEFEVYGDNGISRYMYVTECAFGVEPDFAFFDPDNYPGYSKQAGY